MFDYMTPVSSLILGAALSFIAWTFWDVHRQNKNERG